MDATPANLGTLIEQLEDAQRFHMDAAQQSVGDVRERHLARSWTYSAMLAEIADWQSRGDPAIVPADKRQERIAPAQRPDGYAALLERIYRIHGAAAPATRPTSMHAPGGAASGVAANGGRRAGSRTHV